MINRSVSASGDVSQSIVVTGDGNAVSLRFGDSGLVLPIDRKQVPGPDRRRRPTRDERVRELDVLDPVRGRLPLIGREQELADLQSWLAEDVDISVHGLIGPAGTGKTRLAIGLCAVVDGAQKPGSDWLAGFLPFRALPHLAEVFESASYQWDRSTLLVIDYAAAGYEALGRWLDRLAASPAMKGVKLRLLLLDRQAPEGYGWWHELCNSPMNDSAARRDLFYKQRPDPLSGLDGIEERRRVLAEALAATAALHGTAARSLPELGENEAFAARLSEYQFGNALSLVMAGVIAHERGLAEALALRRLDAARHLGRRELKRFERLAGTDPEAAAIRHLVAFNGMTGGLPLAGLATTLQGELAGIGMAANTQALSVLLQQELPPLGTRQEEAGDLMPRLGTIQPDLIGEAVIVEEFEAPPARQAEGVAAVQRAYALTGAAAARSLMRLLQDYAYAVEDSTATDLERETGTRLLGWLRALAAEIDDPAALEPLAFALPTRTLVLRETASEITSRLAQAYENALAADGGFLTTSAYRAMFWTANLASRLNDLGLRDEAALSAEKAERLARQLYYSDAARFSDDLAHSLNNLATFLSGLGRREDALAAAEEAVGLRRELAAARPDAFTPDLASSLNNLGTFLSDLGRREDALAVAEEAVGLRRELAAARPDAFTPDLAVSLNNLAAFLSDLGRREDALAAAEEAVGLRHELAAARPDAFTPDLAKSLNNLGNFLSAVGRPEDALAAAEEAVGLYRSLAAARPDGFTPDLAISLNNLGNFLSAVGRREDALAAGVEAVGLRRELAAARPDAFTPDLASSLNNLANRFSAVGRREDALAAAEEAVGLYRSLAAARPDAFSVDLSVSLGMFTQLMIAMKEKPRALETITEAIEILEPVFRTSPTAVAHWMHMHLQHYVSLCHELGRQPDEGLLRPIIEVFEKLQKEE